MNLLKKNHTLNQPNLSTVSKAVLTVFAITFINISFAQVDFGIKGGVNYNFGGDLKEIPSSIGSSTENLITSADAKAGFHAGIWAKVNFLGIYLRPELAYTELNNTYGKNTLTNRNDSDFKTKKIDIPILIGAKIIGPLHLFGGPTFQYIMDTDFDVNNLETIKTDDFSVGLQLGAGVNLGRLGIDLRWEKGFNNDANGKFLNTKFDIDNRPNQLIFGLSYQLSKRD